MRPTRLLALCALLAVGCGKPAPSVAPNDGAGLAQGDEGAGSGGDEPGEAKAEKAAPVQQLLAIEGSVTKAQIDELLQAHLNEIRGCYDDALQDPADIELRGAIVVSFTVSKSGAVGASTVALSEFGHPPTENCLAELVGTFVLPKQKRESSVQLPLYMNTL